MPHILHHNLQNYTGRNGARTAEFTEAYDHIQASWGRHFIVAGFTEVLREDANANLAGLANALDPRLRRLVLIEVGQNVGGQRRGRTEYIGIAWDPGDADDPRVSVDYAGIVMPGGFGIHYWEPNLRELAEQPAEIIEIGLTATAVDFRGLSYIGGTYAGRPYLFGFMHNVFTTGNRSVNYTTVVAMADSARSAMAEADRRRGVQDHRRYLNAEIIIGGDFNVDPRNPTTVRGDRLMLYERHAEDRFGPINTTRSNPYDFFLVSNADVLPNSVDVYRFTRRGESETGAASDHAATSLDYVIAG